MCRGAGTDVDSNTTNNELVDKAIGYVELREDLQEFANLMELKLRKKDSLHPSGWDNDFPSELLEQLEKRVEDLRELLGEIEFVDLDSDTFKAQFDDVSVKAADIANFAMMISDLGQKVKNPDFRKKITDHIIDQAEEGDPKAVEVLFNVLAEMMSRTE